MSAIRSRRATAGALFLVLGAALGLLACGAPPAQVAAPTLPGDGSDNVAKPSGATGDADAWRPLGELIVPPAPAEVAPLKLPSVERFTLSNGLPVFFIPSVNTPVGAFQLVIKAGGRAEPKARIGLSELTANLLIKGSVRRNAAALVKSIESVAGTLGIDSTYEATFASCLALARESATCSTMLAELVSAPAFAAKDVEEVRAALLSTVRSRKNPRTLASLHLQQLLWGDNHARGWTETEETLAAITRDDVVAWHRTWYAPNNAMLVVVGDFELAKLRPQLERAFAPWKKRALPPVPKYPDPAMPATRIRLVDNPGAPQTQIRIGLRGISHDDPRFFESLVWNHALGATSGARLSRALRERGAANLSAESTFDRNADRGSIVVSSAARGSEAIAVVQVLLGELARMAKDGPSAAEVASAIATINGSYVNRAETAAELAAGLAGAELHGFGERYLQNFSVRLAQVTPESAKEAAQQLLDLNGSVVVLVGDAKDLEPQLTKAGWRFDKVKVSDPIAKPAATSDVDPQKLAAARKVLDAALKAKGGEPRLRAIKALQMSGKGSTTIESTAMPVEVKRWYQLPDRLRIDVLIDPPGDTPPAAIQIGVDGSTGWQRSPEGMQDIPADDLASVEFERWREPELVLLEARDPQVVARPLPDTDIEGKPHATVAISTPFGIDITLAFDKQTSLLRRMSYTISGENTVDDFSDYRDVAGIKIAHKRRSTAGSRVTTVDLGEVTVNPKIEPSIFAKPAP